jgi:hypothetical protein
MGAWRCTSPHLPLLFLLLSLVGQPLSSPRKLARFKLFTDLPNKYAFFHLFRIRDILLRIRIPYHGPTDPASDPVPDPASDPAQYPALFVNQNPGSASGINASGSETLSVITFNTIH